jgi:hypothetical protein
MATQNNNAGRRNSNPKVDKEPKAAGGKKPKAAPTSNPQKTAKQKNAGQNKPARSKAAATTKAQKFPRAIALGGHLSSLWNVPNRYKNDDFIIDSITGVKTNDISLWSSLNIQYYRIVTNLPTKIKSGTPLQSDDDGIKVFKSTQIEPVYGDRYVALVKSKIGEVFENFPYAQVRAELDDPDRRPIITNGSSSPAALAPAIVGHDNNSQLIAAMALGRKIFRSDFNMANVLYGLADGKLTSVPKNYRVKRWITIASRTLTDKQYGPSVALRDWVTLRSRNVNHIIQFDDQKVQHAMLTYGNATIDLSSASDRVYRSLLEKIWPEFLEWFGDILPTTVIDQNNRVIKLTCIGTQGFPLTFTLMAVVIGLIVEAVKTTNKPSANYGDDISVAEEDFNEVYTALQALGLVVNKQKTHKSSNGFLESCGRDVRFTPSGSRDITPIYLRGESDVEIIQFFYQLCKAKLISAVDATSIMDRLKVEYYAFEYEYQQTEFHFPFGDVKNVPKGTWSYDQSQYMAKVPALKDEVVSIKGLTKSESAVVLELLNISSGLKNPNNSEYTIRGLDPIARQYAIIDLQGHRLYNLYRALDTTEDQVPEIFWEELEEKYKTTFKALSYYRFITSELYRYKFSTATVDFKDLSVSETSLQELINTGFGVKSEVKYPIYRYQTTKTYKLIQHPNNNNIVGVDELRRIESN